MVRDFSDCYNRDISSRSKRISGCFKKIGSYFGKLKNTLSSFQREVNSVTENIDLEKDINKKDNKKENYTDNE